MDLFQKFEFLTIVATRLERSSFCDEETLRQAQDRLKKREWKTEKSP